MKILNKKLSSPFLKEHSHGKPNFLAAHSNKIHNSFKKSESSYSIRNRNSINHLKPGKDWLEIEYDNTELEEGGRI